MTKLNPYVRSFTLGAIWYAALACKMVYESQVPWTAYPLKNFAILVVAWIVTALLVGLVATKFEKFQSWWTVGVGTVAGSLVVSGIMLLMAETTPPPGPTVPKFKTTEEMMKYLASEAVKMSDESYSIKLDYTPDSIKDMDKVLGRLHDDYVRSKSMEGIRGLALMCGAYIGEVIRRTESGVRWERNDEVGGKDSFPLIWHGGSSYVVAWCYKRIINGDEDNVWVKYTAVKEKAISETNSGQQVRAETNSPSPPAGSPR